MKKLLLIVLTLACFSLHAQKWGREVGLNYAYSKPMGGMGEIIDRGHGFTMNYAFVHPSKHFSFGIDFSFAQYGREKTRQEYTFDDGTVAPMDIIVSNYFVNFMAYSRWYLTSEGKFRPFLTGKLGYSRFSTDLNIYDPDDWDHCEPVDTDKLYHDGTFVGVIGAGVKYDLSSIFKKLNTGRFYFEASVNLTQGGSVRYMNADYDPAKHKVHSDVDQVMVDFINNQTKVVHQHHVGYLFENPVQMTEFRFGASWHISRD